MKHQFKIVLIFMFFLISSCQQRLEVLSVHMNTANMILNSNAEKESTLSTFQYFVNNGLRIFKSFSLHKNYFNGLSTIKNFSLTERKYTTVNNAQKTHQVKFENKNNTFSIKNGPVNRTDLTIPAEAQNKRALASVNFKNKTFLYYKNEKTGKLLYTCSSDQIHWTESRSISDNRVKQNFHVNVFHNKMYLFHVKRDGTNSFSTSTDGIHFTELGNINFGNYISHMTTGRLGDTIYFLATTPINTSRGIKYALTLTSTLNFTNFSKPKTIFVNRLPLYTDIQPTILSDGNKLIISYKEFDTEKIYRIYSDDGQKWSSIDTSNSDIALIYN